MRLTAWRKGAPKKVIRKRKPQASSNKFYSTVWLSDYESEPDKLYSPANRSQATTPYSSRATTPYSSQPTSPYSSRPSSPSSTRPNTPLSFYDEDSGLPSEIERSFESIGRSRKKLYRTLSLPDSELTSLQAADLHERFTTLQLEQENQELKKLTSDLQEALEKLEERVNEMQTIENDSLDGEALPYRSPQLDLPLESPTSLYLHELPCAPSQSGTQEYFVDGKKPKNHRARSSKKKKSNSSCCVS